MPLNRIRQFTTSDVFKSFTVLFSGTLMAQVIGYAIAPILTRLYSNAEMGEMLYYMRLIAFISSIATLRYEAALPLPKRDEHSYLMYRFVYLFSFWVLVFIACFLLVFSLVFGFINLKPWFILSVILGADQAELVFDRCAPDIGQALGETLTGGLHHHMFQPVLWFPARRHRLMRIFIFKIV